MTLRLPRRAALLAAAIAPFAVAFLGNARRPADSPAPALACTGMPTVLAFPAGTDVPVNATLRMLSSGETLEVRPSDGIYELRSGGTPVAVDARTMDGSVELLPKARLKASTAFEVWWTLRGNPAGEARWKLTSFQTGTRVDTTAPVLRSVGAPAFHPTRAESTSDCDPWQWMVVPIAVTDDSDVVIAAWFAGAGGRLDTTRPPDVYGQPRSGSVELVLTGAASNDKAPDYGRYTIARGPFALMALDAAGNRSDVVTVPGARRSPAVVWPPGSAVMGTVATTAPPGSAPVADAAPAVPPATAALPTASAAAASAIQPPAERPPAGCGCGLTPG
jgi:hypothetical protein